MSSPFDQWPAGYGPDDRYGAGGDEPPPYADQDAPVSEDVLPPVDQSSGEVGGGGQGNGPRRPTGSESDPAELNVSEFLAWVGLQLGRQETYGALAADSPAWCSEWWKHPEVVERLIVAYQAYVKASKMQHEGDMLALSAWWVQHWDHHTRIIFDAACGPFRACGYDGHLSKSGGRDTLTITPENPPEAWEP